ncbi:U4/U6.U5 tri-snRNP-associated protein 2, putative [Plasmodium chabaudi chabaudi]|uniref:U4/U6.U5 tri-snRNP-associated protein 2, putative n=1 Tax=Plasmodium chabaudi chabaudi TaxID=31271 RepID=A0A4V6M9V0_PLACU|nr:U4/U6.U5 tri-snRNP-associated protein 2, putative [Plasmodium chabaudi chabaudi]VTZ70850.1 U4/U6.U5 tri-snRNP-associated protein 2, putative [Plasmodium chabaudi chabaudi]|eukprot:XP_738578.2 U4/U6.U5 tri-snRNP-associated protein 2, putative [Plasmodium chabaudi chabaudi]
MPRKPEKKIKNDDDDGVVPKRRKNEKNKNSSETETNAKNNLNKREQIDNNINDKNESYNKTTKNNENDSINNTSDNNKIRVCPYLRTINRNLLDFDFEKLCSISLSNLHVYACLVCGIYFQGIGRGTYAYTHALEKNHYVFINLETCKTCCIPENYEIHDASLNDIKYFLKPVYNKEQVEHLCNNLILGKSLDGADFFPGCVGLNNLKHTDYCNVIIQLLCCIVPLRNMLLLYESKQNIAKNLIVVLAELLKKIYNPKNFKGVVSPHEFLQAVGIESKKNFKIGTKNDPLNFFLWIINKIHRHSEKKLQKKKKNIPNQTNKQNNLIDNNDISKNGHPKNDEGVKKSTSAKKDNNTAEQNKQDTNYESDKSSSHKKKKIKWMYDGVNIIDYCFDGELIIKTKKTKDDITEDGTNYDGINDTSGGTNSIGPNRNDNNSSQDEGDNEFSEDKNYIFKKTPFRTLSLKLPNPPIFKSTTESNIIPQVSIFELLTKYDGETETFLSDKAVPSTLIISKLPKYLIFTIQRFSKNNFFTEKNGTIVNFVIKNLDMKDYVHQDYLDQNPVTKYNLVANIFHSGTVTNGSYKIHVLQQATNEWYEIEDLHVISILPQLVLLPESCIQLYQRQDVQLNGEIL